MSNNTENHLISERLHEIRRRRDQEVALAAAAATDALQKLDTALSELTRVQADRAEFLQAWVSDLEQAQMDEVAE